MLKFICICLGVAIFIGFMILVGNPHYIETIIGLCLGIFTGFGAYFKLSKKKNDTIKL